MEQDEFKTFVFLWKTYLKFFFVSLFVIKLKTISKFSQLFIETTFDGFWIKVKLKVLMFC
jgi:hypothetical protein